MVITETEDPEQVQHICGLIIESLRPTDFTVRYSDNELAVLLPAANAQGDVEYPVVDLGSEMTDLVQAQTSYQANAEVMSHATDAYQAILDIKA